MLCILTLYFNPALNILKARLQPENKHILNGKVGDAVEKMDNKC